MRNIKDERLPASPVHWDANTGSEPVNAMNNKIIHLLLGAAVLLAFPLIYLALLRPGHATLSPSQWLLFASLAVALVLGAFLPSFVRRVRGLPQHPVSSSDLRFTIALSLVLCPLAFFAVWMFGAYGSLVIMLAPIAFAFRNPRLSQPSPK
jgi:hypothetical protein